VISERRFAAAVERLSYRRLINFALRDPRARDCNGETLGLLWQRVFRPWAFAKLYNRLTVRGLQIEGDPSSGEGLERAVRPDG
jgi:hypothetical protein